jgi:hypothetical protein
MAPLQRGFYLIDVALDPAGVESPEKAVNALRSRAEVVRFADLAAQ